MEPQEINFFFSDAGRFIFMLILKFESSGLYTSSAKEKFPLAHIPFKAGYTLLTFMPVLFEVLRNVNFANTCPTCS